MNRRLVVSLLMCALGLAACSKANQPVASPTPTDSATTQSSATPTPSASKVATPAKSATPAPPEAIEACGASDLKVSVLTDRTTYSTAQTVKISMVARNTSAHACKTEGNACMNAVNVKDSGGNIVWRSTPIGVACSAPSKRVVGPGKTQTYSYTWDQKPCSGSGPCAQYFAPSGNYTANGAWHLGSGDGVAATPAKFKIS